MVGTWGMKPIAMPPRTKTIGYAMLMRFAIVTSTMMAAKTTASALAA